MSDHDEVRSARDVDAERFVDEELDEVDGAVTRLVDLPADGSVPDIIDQHTPVPSDDDV